MAWTLVWTGLILFLTLVEGQIGGCKDEQGGSVPWWSILKAPNGVTYVYADSKNAAFKTSAYLLTDAANGALSLTLQQIYQTYQTKSKTDYAYAFYNDEKPDGSTTSSRGHTKGVVALNNQTGGFWLVHSVPGFPNYVNLTGSYPGYDAAPDYGQSFLCISLDFNQFTNVGTQFQYNYPWWYDSNIPTWTPKTLYDAVVSSKHFTSPNNSVVSIAASGSTQAFMSFAKTGQWDNYLYESLVAPTLKSDIRCETWMNGAGTPIPTTCSNATYLYDVINIRNVTVNGMFWKETQDHSKWCTATNDGPRYVCIGDINHMVSQNSRGGGTVCFLQTDFWTSMNAIISGADVCPSLDNDDPRKSAGHSIHYFNMIILLGIFLSLVL